MLRASIRSALFGALLIGLSSGTAAVASQAKSPSKSQAKKPAVNANALVIKDFLKRVDDYVAQHKKLEDPLPKLSKHSTPQELDRHERALAKLIQDGRDRKSTRLISS